MYKNCLSEISNVGFEAFMWQSVWTRVSFNDKHSMLIQSLDKGSKKEKNGDAVMSLTLIKSRKVLGFNVSIEQTMIRMFLCKIFITINISYKPLRFVRDF